MRRWTDLPFWCWSCTVQPQERPGTCDSLPAYNKKRKSEGPSQCFDFALHSNLNCLKIAQGAIRNNSNTGHIFIQLATLVFTLTSTGQCLGQLQVPAVSRLKKSTFLLLVKQQQQTDQDTTRRREGGGQLTDLCPVSSNGSADHLRLSQKENL